MSDDDVVLEGRIAIRSFSTRTEAENLRGVLESEGIAAWVSADDAGGLYPSLTLADGARLLVRERDRERAESVLGPDVSQPDG